MTELVYCYDGSFDGFLCCVFDSYANHEVPTAITRDEDFEPTLFATRQVVTDTGHARRVYRKIRQISPDAASLLRRGFLSCMPEMELHLYRFIAKLLKDGPGFLENLSDGTLYPVLKAVRFLGAEVEKLRGFVRFSDLGGVLGSEIEPRNRVLPVLRNHFCSRYQNEKFFIYDRTHREALFYAAGKAVILPLDHFQMAEPDETEVSYRLLWKRFYDTIAIKERENPRCQNTHMPKRYRGTMTEFMGPEAFRARRSPEDGPVLSSPAGRSAPGTPLPPGPSAPGSAP
ncbi:MAG: TIGR03915 family putative DNA repair protein [Dysosmobacter sp.]|nr:TIGR03915 family putative DNA repair protein [Dysosmobacter sp.]